MEWVDFLQSALVPLWRLERSSRWGLNCMQNLGTVLNLDYGLVVAVG